MIVAIILIITDPIALDQNLPIILQARYYN